MSVHVCIGGLGEGVSVYVCVCVCVWGLCGCGWVDLCVCVLYISTSVWRERGMWHSKEEGRRNNSSVAFFFMAARYGYKSTHSYGFCLVSWEISMLIVWNYMTLSKQHTNMLLQKSMLLYTNKWGRNSSVGSAWALCPQCRGFDPHLGTFSVEGIFPLELTWVQTPFPPKLLRMRV